MLTRKLLMIPGPTPVTRTVQNQMGRETAAFGDPNFVNTYRELLLDLKTMWNAGGEVFVISGSGTLAMEMAAANTLKTGDRLLLISHGYFGDRFAEMCRGKGIQVDTLSSSWGQTVSMKIIEESLDSKSYQALAVTHVDTSTGVCAPLDEIGKLLKKRKKTLFIVDGVCATAAEPEDMKELGIDILLSGSQKAFGVPPGLAMVWASAGALQKREELGSIPEYYVDFQRWLPVMKDPSKYFATPPVNMIWAMKEAVDIIKAEGLENRYRRHRITAQAFQKALESLGFTHLAHPSCRAATLSNVIYPEGIEDASFRKVLAEEGVVVAGGLGAYAGKMFRIGHMGNVEIHDLVASLAAIERTLHRLDYPIIFGTGVGTFLNKLQGEEEGS